jgi:hypothetical protein
MAASIATGGGDKAGSATAPLPPLERVAGLAGPRGEAAAIGWTAANGPQPSPDTLASLSPLAFVVGAQAEAFSAVHAALASVGSDLAPAATRDSDAEGCFEACTVQGPPALLSHTLTLSAPEGPLDWAHQTFATGEFGGYTKTSVLLKSPGGAGVAASPVQAPLTPHLQIELLARPQPGAPLLLCMSMEPRVSLQLWPGYLDRYYCTAPPLSDAPSGGSAPPLPSWSALERACAGRPGFERFVSPNLHVRAFCATGVMFDVADGPEGRAAILDTIAQGVAIWGAWLRADCAGSSGGGAAGDGSQGDWLIAGAPFEGATVADAIASVHVHDAALLHFPRRELSAAALKAAYGDATAEAWWATMAGSNRLANSFSTYQSTR